MVRRRLSNYIYVANFDEVGASDSSKQTELIEGRDSRTFFSDPTEAKIVKITLITINKVAVRAVNRDNKFAEPLGDIIPPTPPPPPLLLKLLLIQLCPPSEMQELDRLGFSREASAAVME